MRLCMRSIEITQSESEPVFFQLNRVLPDSILQAGFDVMKTSIQDSERIVLGEGEQQHQAVPLPSLRSCITLSTEDCKGLKVTAVIYFPLSFHTEHPCSHSLLHPELHHTPNPQGMMQKDAGNIAGLEMMAHREMGRGWQVLTAPPADTFRGRSAQKQHSTAKIRGGAGGAGRCSGRDVHRVGCGKLAGGCTKPAVSQSKQLLLQVPAWLSAQRGTEAQGEVLETELGAPGALTFTSWAAPGFAGDGGAIYLLHLCCRQRASSSEHRASHSTVHHTALCCPAPLLEMCKRTHSKKAP